MAPPSAAALRVFLGIFTRVSQYEHRALMRATMLSILPSAAVGSIEYRFVVCGTNAFSATADERRDVLVLNVSNNVAGRGMCGKHRGSLELLVAIDALWPLDAFDWIAKTDVDAFVVLPNLLRALAPLPRHDGYFGIHCLSGHFGNGVQLFRPYAIGDEVSHRRLFWDDLDNEWPFWFMCGMLYAVTRDVAHWLRTEARPPSTRFGMTGEDYLLRTWLHRGRRGANAHTCLWAHCYDLPMPSAASQNALPSETATQPGLRADAAPHAPRESLWRHRQHVGGHTFPPEVPAGTSAAGGAGNVTLAIEKALWQRHREAHRDPPDPAADEAAAHGGVSARVAAWLSYGHRMLLETVVVHNIKTFGEWLSIASYFERHRQRLVQAKPPQSSGVGSGGDRPGVSTRGAGGGRHGLAGRLHHHRGTSAAEAGGRVTRGGGVDAYASPGARGEGAPTTWSLPLRPRDEWRQAQAAYCSFLGLPAPSGDSDWRARPGCQIPGKKRKP